MPCEDRDTPGGPPVMTEADTGVMQLPAKAYHGLPATT